MRAQRLQFCISLTLLGLAYLPAQAQIRATRDERGTLVFVNDAAPSSRATPRKTSFVPSAPKAETAPKQASRPLTATPSSDSASSPARSRPTSPEELVQIVERTAEKHRVDSRLVRAVIATESNWNAGAISSKGAQGLMQLIPETAHRMGVSDAFDPEQNIDGGVRYLSLMLDRYNGDVHRALAAYNAGPGAVDRSGGIPRFTETQNYVQKVTSAYFRGTGLQPRNVAAPVQIYRVVEADGRIVFRNE